MAELNNNDCDSINYANDYWYNNEEYNEIESHLYLGSEMTVKSGPILRELRAKHVLSVCDSELIELPHVSVNYKHIEAGDFPDQDLLSTFEDCYRFIDYAQQRGESVVVQCASGMSRSATVVIAYIMKKYRLSLTLAINRVAKARKVFPNEGFIKQLQLYEKMNYQLDGRDEEYRRFLLKTLTYELRRHQKSDHYFEKQALFVRQFFNKIRFSEQFISINNGQSFQCTNCKNNLFYEINIIGDNRAKSIANECHKIFIEPMQTYYTKELDENTGYLKCLRCERTFGTYNWHLYGCECDLHRDYSDCLALLVYRKCIALDESSDMSFLN